MSINNAEFKSNFGLRLKTFRKAAGLNQSELANWANISRDSLSRYERGEIVPSAEVLSLLVSGLGPNVSADDLLFGSPESLETPVPIFLKGFGALTGLGFNKGGTARVSMGASEVVSILKGCIEFEERASNPNQKIIDSLWALRTHYYEDEYSDTIEMIAEVIIAVHGVTLVPEIPYEDIGKRAAILKKANEAEKSENPK